MCTKKQALIFLAGAETFHTFVHVCIAFMGQFPYQMPWMTLTQTLNVWAIAVNAAITIGLLYWASKLKK